MATYKLTQQSGNFAGSSHSDFPAYVDLSEIDASMSQADADSIRVYSDASLSTELAREIVSTEEMHVKIPTFTSGDEIWVDIDGSRADYNTTDTFGAENVWSDYRAVWHLDDLTDSTGNGYTLTNTNATQVTAKVGGGYSFNGSNAYLTIPNTAFDNQALFHYTFWVFPNGVSQDAPPMHFQGQYNTQVYQEATGNLFLHQTYDGSNVTNSEASASDATWQKITAEYDGTDNNIYKNGSQADTNAANTPVSLTVESRIGAHRSGSSFFEGDVDEARLRHSTTSVNWETTEYNNQNSPSTFWSVEEVVEDESNAIAFGANF